MATWPQKDWFDKQTGEDVWMVCRNGHLWRAQVPNYADFLPATSGVIGRMRKERMRRVTRCAMCTTLKEAGFKHLRGITKVCPDWQGKIDARELANGTIEHHKPTQVAEVYSEEAVKSWGALLALINLQMNRPGFWPR